MTPTDALALKTLLESRPVAALGTLHRNEPAVSMVPYALLAAEPRFVIHVSGLATHTKDMLENPAVSLLVMDAVEAADSPLALPRASIQGLARPCLPESTDYAAAKAAYLARLPDAADLFTFADFSLFLIEPRMVRYVAGFGKAMSVTATQLAQMFGNVG